MRQAVLALTALSASSTGAFDCPHKPGGGSFVTDLVVIRLPTPSVQQMVKRMTLDRLSLAPELAALPDVPVILGFGVQSNVCDNTGDTTGGTDKFDLQYNVFSMTMPSVMISRPKKGQPSGPLVTSGATYVSDVVAGLGLSLVYLEDRALAHFNRTTGGGEERWEVSEWVTGAPTASLAAQGGGEWAPASSLPRGGLAALVAGALNTSFTGHAAPTHDDTISTEKIAPGACFDRQVAWESASAMPISGTLGVHRAYASGMPVAEYPFTPASGVRVRGVWRQSFPNDCTIAEANPASLRAWLQLRGAAAAPLPRRPASARPAPVPPAPKIECPFGPDFPGNMQPKKLTGGGGSYLSDFVTVPVPTAHIQKMLPDHLELAPELRPLAWLPVLFLFGLQYNVCDNNGDEEFLNGRRFTMTYYEFIMEGPTVQYRDGSRGGAQFGWQPRLFLNDTLPVMLGWAFGIPKKLANFTHDEASCTENHASCTWSSDAWNITDPASQELMISMEADNLTDWRHPSELATHQRGLVDAVTEVVGGGAAGFCGDVIGGQYQVCASLLPVASAKTRAQVIRGTFATHTPFVPNMPVFSHKFAAGVRMNWNWTMRYAVPANGAPDEEQTARTSSAAAWLRLRGAMVEADRAA